MSGRPRAHTHNYTSTSNRAGGVGVGRTGAPVSVHQPYALGVHVWLPAPQLHQGRGNVYATCLPFSSHYHLSCGCSSPVAFCQNFSAVRACYCCVQQLSVSRQGEWRRVPLTVLQRIEHRAARGRTHALPSRRPHPSSLSLTSPTITFSSCSDAVNIALRMQVGSRSCRVASSIVLAPCLPRKLQQSKIPASAFAAPRGCERATQQTKNLEG